ncbi:MAG: imidazole glycerol phosphate synthase subunit HisH [Flavobacteriales bacterium]
MKIVIIDYKAGNIRSVKLAFRRLGVEAELTANADEIANADKVVFPGVGEASWAMNQLQKGGLDKLIPTLKQPLLGICLGMQLLCEHTEEGDTACLGVFPTKVKHFDPNGTTGLKVPHVGWNDVSNLKSPLFKDIIENEYMYFVHSYYAEQSEFSLATADYVLPFSAALRRNNFYAVQFHPERSGEAGEQLLKNFLEV